MLTFCDFGRFCPDFVRFWPDGLEIQMGSSGRPIRKQQWENSIRQARCSHPAIWSIWNIGFPTAQFQVQTSESDRKRHSQADVHLSPSGLAPLGASGCCYHQNTWACVPQLRYRGTEVRYSTAPPWELADLGVRLHPVAALDVTIRNQNQN